MALDSEDKKYIADQISSALAKNNRELIIQFAQIFPTKIEVKEMINESLIEVKSRLSKLEDISASILHRLDVEQLPFIERRIDILEKNHNRLETEVKNIKSRL